jgi:orotidine-5'-phosphate decarboxylase
VSFGERLSRVFSTSGNLCVGIDPHASLLSQWGLEQGPAGLREFGLRVVDAAAGRVGIVKPQVAFFEAHGSAGLLALEDVLSAARAAGLLVIGDAKRGDIGSTMEGYTEAWLRNGSPLEVDALTVSPYLGVDSLARTRATADAHGKGLFVLAATSNPEAGAIQTVRTPSGSTVAATIVETVSNWNAGEPLGSTGVVVGATVDLAAVGIEPSSLAGIPVLAPGFGHQGAEFSDVRRLFGEAADSVLLSASRSILSAGPTGIADAIERQAAEVAAALSS